jgi:anti-anti-sigma factor
MRRNVPFTGENNIIRSPDEQAQAKKARGQVIDDVISTQSQPTTWDDHVVFDDNFELNQPAPPSVKRPPVVRPHTPPKPAHHIPRSTGSALKRAVIEANLSGPVVDWVPINNGHGLRISISGCLDQSIRNEWRRMIDETANTSAEQFEFNLTQAPTLTLTGLGMLLMFKEEKGSARGDIKLCHCSKEVWDILQWTGMDKYFTIQGAPGID